MTALTGAAFSATLSGMEAFLLNPANRDFAEGKGPYRPADLTRRTSVAGSVAKFLSIAGVLITIGAGVLYLYQDRQHDQLLASVKTVTAWVTGCAGPGMFQQIHFHYRVDGKEYDQSAYSQYREFMGPTTMMDACKTTMVELNYLPSDPNRWSAAPISPFTRDEREAKPGPGMFIAGLMVLSFGGIAALVAFGFRKQMERQETLKTRGIVLRAELLQMEEDKSDDSAYNVICRYHFTNPAGVLMKGRTGAYRKDLKKSNYPPPGTPVYVIYATDKIFDML
jgi:hypothetical protein